MIQNTLKYCYAFVLITLSLFVATCSLDRIEPTGIYDPCLGIVTAKFSHDKLSITCDSPCIVQFTNQSTGAKSFAWDFGEGGSSIEVNPKYTFKKAGRWNVKLTATSENGCSKEWVEIVTVTSPNTPNPIADFTFPTGMLFAPVTVTFTNISPIGNEFCWYVNDSLFSTLRDPTFNFTQPGDYSIKLVAKLGFKVSPPKIQVVTIKRNTFDLVQPGFGPAQKVVALPTGEFVVAGTTYTGTNSSIYIFKTDANGLILTTFKPTLSLSTKDVLTDMIQLADGSFALCGSTLSASMTNSDGFFARVRADGSVSVPPTRFGDTARDGYPLSMVELTTGFVVFAGVANVLASGNNDVWLTRRSPSDISNSNLDRTYPAAQAEFGNDVEFTTDGNLMIFGTASPITAATTQSFLLKTDLNGNVLAGFPKIISKTTDFSYAKTMARMTSGKLVLGGYILPNSGESKGWLTVIDALGGISSGFPMNIGAMGLVEQIQDVQEISTGDFVCVGTKGTNGAWLARVTPTGTIARDTMFGTVNSNIFYAVRPTLDAGFIMVGGKAGSAYMVRYKL
jgi:hypothetical protein